MPYSSVGCHVATIVKTTLCRLRFLARKTPLLKQKQHAICGKNVIFKYAEITLAKITAETIRLLQLNKYNYIITF